MGSERGGGRTPLYRAASCERTEGFRGEAMSAILLAGFVVPTGMLLDIMAITLGLGKLCVVKFINLDGGVISFEVEFLTIQS